MLIGDVEGKKKNGWIQAALCPTLLLLLLTQLTFAVADSSIEEQLTAAKNSNDHYVTYDLDELGMSVDIMWEYTVFTRDTTAEDPGYESYGVSKADVDSMMESNNIYLDALSPDADKEIMITRFEGISIVLRAFAEISSATEKEFQLLINRVDFWNAKKAAANSESTPSFLYTDTESGLSFTVPENWTQAPMNEPRQFLDAKFVPNSGDGNRVCILFSCEDIYGNEELQNELTPIEKKFLSRSDVTNMAAMSKKDVAEIVGVKESDVTVVSHGGKDYFSAPTAIRTTIGEAEISLPMTCRLCLENGYLYMFQFGGSTDSPYFADFEALINSVEYPVISSDDADGSGETFLLDDTAFPGLLLTIGNLIGTVSIYTLPIVIYRYGIVKKPLNKKKAKRIVIIYGICAFLVMSVLIVAINGSGAAGGAIILWSWVNYKILTGGKNGSDNTEKPLSTEPGPDAEAIMPGTSEVIGTTAIELADTDPVPETVFCRWCGTQLPAESEFCHKCGKKVKGDDVKDDRLL